MNTPAGKNTPANFLAEIKKRRTFAIISHPDAGKTTMTEKLLLFGGAIRLAGVVKSKKSKKFATSDWMEIEKQRGISVTSSVMRFSYKNHDINLLDTPGHSDFSEDTYRVLTAVDSVLMMIDGVKGVEAQTIKLLEVCRARNMPIMTFINKFDRETREPLELMSEIEDILKVQCAPITWPVGCGKNFKGVYDLREKTMLLYKPGEQTTDFEVKKINDIHSAELTQLLGKNNADTLRNDVLLLNEAGNPFVSEDYLKGTLSPVFFGSALNNFGVKEFLEAFFTVAPSPGPKSTLRRIVEPSEKKMSGFIFKIQANMDPNHRDRIAFMRICSGKYEKGKKLFHCRTGKELKIANSVMFMAREIENTEVAYPGDILGIRDTGNLFIADTLTEGEQLQFTGIPNFSPEMFSRIRLANPLKNKQLEKGIAQLTEEGIAQRFRPAAGGLPIIGVVGALQFEVIKFRLMHEYGVDGIFERLPYSLARWYSCDNADTLKAFELRYANQLAYDKAGTRIFLSTSEWEIQFSSEKFKGVSFYTNSDMR